MEDSSASSEAPRKAIAKKLIVGIDPGKGGIIDTGTIIIGAVTIVAVTGVMVVARRWRSRRPSDTLADPV